MFLTTVPDTAQGNSDAVLGLILSSVMPPTARTVSVTPPNPDFRPIGDTGNINQFQTPRKT